MLNHGSSPNMTSNPCPFVLLFSVAGSGQAMGFPIGYMNVTAVYVPVKSKALKNRFSGSFFFVRAFTLISYSLEHKLQGRTSRVAPV